MKATIANANEINKLAIIAKLMGLWDRRAIADYTNNMRNTSR